MAATQQDEQYLKILSIFHFVVGGIAGLFACFPVFHLAMGVAIEMLRNKVKKEKR